MIRTNLPDHTFKQDSDSEFVMMDAHGPEFTFSDSFQSPLASRHTNPDSQVHTPIHPDVDTALMNCFISNTNLHVHSDDIPEVVANTNNDGKHAHISGNNGNVGDANNDDDDSHDHLGDDHADICGVHGYGDEHEHIGDVHTFVEAQEHDIEVISNDYYVDKDYAAGHDCYNARLDNNDKNN